ncbi:DUF4007 family protein [Mastigocoleus testarum]|uniref:DUF4007 family protein n=1 Tax=Mastigocoleus testarum TaxID=996925 RepID=UPI00137A8ACE|nr:DUF4007 family protein [Mastigocoleus testarum]
MKATSFPSSKLEATEKVLDINYVFARHETFHPRHGWLTLPGLKTQRFLVR